MNQTDKQTHTEPNRICAGYVTPQGAVFIGIIAAVVCYLCLALTRKMKWDDALGVWGVHGMGGVTGSIFVGLFAVYEVNGVTGGIKQFLIQLLGVAIVIVYTCIVCWIIFKVCDKVMKIRVPREVQEEGLDMHYMVENDLPFPSEMEKTDRV